jgi:hypothetical protein
MAEERRNMLRRAIAKMRGSVVGRMHTMPWKPGKGPRGDEAVDPDPTARKKLLVQNQDGGRKRQRGGTPWTHPDEIKRRGQRADREAFWKEMARKPDVGRMVNRVRNRDGLGPDATRKPSDTYYDKSGGRKRKRTR